MYWSQGDKKELIDDEKYMRREVVSDSNSFSVLYDDNSTISIQYTEKELKKEFDFKDWILNCYEEKSFKKELEETFLKKADGMLNGDINMKEM